MTTSAVPSVADLWRTHRRTVMLVVALVVLFAITVAVLFTRQPEDNAVLGADNPGPTGGQAVAGVVADHGVDVRPASSLDEVRALLEEDPEARVLIYDEGILESSPERLDEVAETVPAEQRVLVAPTASMAEVLAEGITVGESLDDVEASAGCELPLAREAETVTGNGVELTWDAENSDATDAHTCFETENGHALIQDPAGTTVIGLYDVLTNRGVSEEGNAVVALWSAAATNTLIWYLPGMADLYVEGGTPGPVMPDWVRPGILWLVVIAVVGMIWAGRRHGPVVVEPFPAQVSPLESSVGRARLYERGNQQTAALDTLQRGAVLRMARLLRTPDDTDSVITETARVLGRDRANVESVLDPRRRPEKLSRSELVTRSRRLLALERELASSLTHPTKENR